MISKAAACPCVKSPAMCSGSWWHGNELGHLDFDLDRRRPQCFCATAIEGRHAPVGAFFGFRRADSVIEHGDSAQERALLERHAVLRGERLRVGGRSHQGSGEHRVPDAVARLCGRGRRIGARARRDSVAGEGARNRVDLCRCGSRVQEYVMMPFLPFTRPTIDAESIAAVADVFRSGQLASGPKVHAFEAALAAYLGAGRHVRVMTSATAGLERALEAAGIGEGDEVIVPAMSFAASANVVARLRAKPIFVDIDLYSRNLNVDLVNAAITPRTRAIMPVHFSGLPVDMDAVHAIAAQHGLRVVEDAAHAIGSRYQGRLIGSFGDLAVFSFHPNKNMTCIEGGAIATADGQTAALFEQYRFHGIKRSAQGEVDCLFPGTKSNLTDVAAQIGIDQLRRLDAFNARRRELAGRYF